MGVSILAALNELLGAEEEVWKAWGTGSVAAVNRVLTQEERTRFDALREQLYASEMTVYNALRDLATPLGLADRIPEPTRVPALPDNASPTPAVLNTAGLGVIPVAGWVALVLAVLIEVAALAYIATRLGQVTGDTLVRIFSVRANSARYEAQLRAANDRFTACLRGGRSPADCAGAAPLPLPPLESTAPTRTDYVFEIIAGGVVAVGLGLVGYGVLREHKRGRL